MEFEEIPILWFFDLAINSGRTTSPETCQGYAEAILDFSIHVNLMIGIGKK